MCLLCECISLDQFYRRIDTSRDAVEETRQVYEYLSPGNPATDGRAPAPSADRDKPYKPATS